MFTHSTCPWAAAEAEFPSPGVDTEVTSLRGRALWGCDSLGERGWHRAWGFRAVSCLGRAGFVFIQLLWRRALRASLLAMKIQVGALCPAAPERTEQTLGFTLYLSTTFSWSSLLSNLVNLGWTVQSLCAADTAPCMVPCWLL